MMTRKDAEHLTALLHAIRPTWDPQGILHALGDVAGRDLATVVVAAVRAATNPQVKTPAVIAMPGPHWETTAPRKQVVDAAARCDDCGGFHTRLSPCNPREAARDVGDGELQYRAARVDLRARKHEEDQ